MKVQGDFDAYIIDADTGVVVNRVHGHNTFTNTGKQMVCDWLKHDNWTTDVVPQSLSGAGGRSVSTMKIIPYNEYTVNRIGTSGYVGTIANCYYPLNTQNSAVGLYSANNSWTSYTRDYGTLYFQFTTPKDIEAVMVWGYSDGGNQYRQQGEWSTSPDPYINDTNWTVQKLSSFCTTEDTETLRCNMIRFDQWNYPGRILTGVKTLRYRCRYEDWTQAWTYWYGVWFLQPNHYPCTPSVIALGTSLTSPTVSDTTLGSESLRRWVRTHKSTGNVTQVRYSTRLERDEGNSVTYNEIGLFANPLPNSYIGGDRTPSLMTNMFARGLFSVPWSKANWQIVDVDYTLTLTP